MSTYTKVRWHRVRAEAHGRSVTWCMGAGFMFAKAKAWHLADVDRMARIAACTGWTALAAAVGPDHPMRELLLARSRGLRADGRPVTHGLGGGA